MTNNNEFAALLYTLKNLPSVPPDALEQIDQALRENFPSLFED